MVQVIKRDGRLTDFNKEKIQRAIEMAMKETEKGVDVDLSLLISDEIHKEVDAKDTVEVEDLQDMVEFSLMASPRKDVAKRYIIYRNEQDKTRIKRKDKERLLTDDFISKYKHADSPMTQLGSFVYYRTYSRFLPEEKRREFWWETVRRAVEYNCSLVPTTRQEAEELYDNIFHLRQFLSGRTFWVGQTPVAGHYPMSNYNCSFQIIDSFDSFRDIFYLLMVGSGVGVRILNDDVTKMPKARVDYELIHKDYTAIPRLKEKTAQA